jgi:hypothetical protein
MQGQMQTLQDFIKPRGALTAAARHLDRNPSTVMRWARGTWKAREASQSRVDLMLQTLVFCPNAKKLTPRLSEVKTPRKSRSAMENAK